MNILKTYTVETKDRLDKNLVKLTNFSRTKINELIKNKLILINGDYALKSGQIIKEKTEVTILKNNDILIKEEVQEKKLFDYELDIKYEDDHLLIINKQSNILSHPTLFNEINTLADAVKQYLNLKNYPFLVHRLDKKTSGLIIFAKDYETQIKMQELMALKLIEKKYFALVNNCFKEKKIIINLPISRSFQSKIRMQVIKGKNSKESITEVNIIENFQNTALIECILHTGRTHQIRVHLSYIGHSLLGDEIYGSKKNKTDYGQYLIAYSLKFNHPITNEKINIKIDYDKEFKDKILELKKGEYFHGK